MWQGYAKETARVPPLLDSPLSAAPETFLSRDAVSAFPLLFVPLPQSLPGVRCRVWAAPVRSPWRFCVNLSPPRCCRGDRPAVSPATDSQFRPRSAGCRDSCACREVRPSGKKIRVQGCPARGLKSPDRRRLRRSPKMPRAQEPPAARAAPIAPARFPKLAGRDPFPKLFPWSAAWRSPACDRPCRPSHPHTSRRAEYAASPESLPTEPAYAVRSNLNAQIVQCLFVFRRHRITVHLIQEPAVIPDFQVRQVSLDVHFPLHLRRFSEYRWNQNAPRAIHLDHLTVIIRTR